MAIRLLRTRREHISLADIWRLLLFPMDSFRYFELNFVWDALSNHAINYYLDVSSPRLLPLMLARRKRHLRAHLINPDPADLAFTDNLIKAFGLAERCDLHGCLISAAPFKVGSFDVVTSISVVEHIPNDKEAIQKLWDFVRPGGRLLLTVPCAAQACDEYIDRNEYGLLEPGEDGFFFFQRLYDNRLLSENVFRITGQPSSHSIYGEKTPGAYHRNQRSKWSDPDYPVWREPYMMCQEYGYFDSVEQLPGVGVIALEFVKD